MPFSSNWRPGSTRNSKAGAGVARQDILVTIRDGQANSRYSVQIVLMEEDHVFSCQSLMRSHHPVRTCNAGIRSKEASRGSFRSKKPTW